jgi:hypothetical protein
MRYHILQMARPEFLPLALLKGPVDLSRYRETYAGEIDGTPTAALEDLFRTFNINHPNDFRSHSLSVGDIVRLDGAGLFYCDTIGWAEIPGPNH